MIGHKGLHPPRTGIHATLAPVLFPILFCLCSALSAAAAQQIYAENQIPARGVDIAYTVTIKNPTSHVYDIEISIRGIRDTSVSVSIPAWSPGMYRIENY